MNVVSVLTQEVEGCMSGPNAGKLTVAACLALSKTLAAASGRPVATDEDLTRVLRLVVEVSRIAGTAKSLPVERRGQLVGVLAYFGLGRPVSPKEQQAVQALIVRKHLAKSRSMDTQPARFIIAHWREVRCLYPGKHETPPESAAKTGQNHRKLYAQALAELVAETCAKPESLRQQLADGRELPQTPQFAHLWRMSQTYSADMRMEQRQYVPRSIQPTLLNQITADMSPRAYLITGEAGTGKSTLLTSLHETLNTDPGKVAILVSAAWLAQPTSTDQFIDDATAAISQLRSRQLRPVILIDTIDILLHDEHSQVRIRQLVNILLSGGASVVCSCRPQETASIKGDYDLVAELAGYNDTELDNAVSSLTARYCPSTDTALIASGVRQAVVSGLPVAEVCRSPLMLGWLFELAAPNPPQFTDLDMVGLIDRYWHMRVERDARREATTTFRTSPDENLAAAAGWAGIGLLSRGMPQLSREVMLRAMIEAAANQTDLNTVAIAVDILSERGVLNRSGDLIGFSHQTLFEFAAAKGLLAAANPTLFTILADRVIDGGDLFVGAVLERMLLIAGTKDPILTPAAQAATMRLLATPIASIQRIGAIAWAYHPTLANDTSWMAGLVSVWPATCAARVIPEIVGKPSREAAQQLTVLWQTLGFFQGDVFNARATILEALRRIAERCPDIADVITQMAGFEGFLHEAGGTQDTCLYLLKTLAERDPVPARRLIMSVATKPPLLVEPMRLAAKNWAQLGSPELLETAINTAAQDPNLNEAATLPVLADLIVAETTTPHTNQTQSLPPTAQWQTRIDSVFRQHGHAERGAMLRLEITRAQLPELDENTLNAAIETLLDTTPGQVFNHITANLLPAILRVADNVSDVLKQRIAKEMETIGLAAQLKRISPTQQTCLALLVTPKCPSEIAAATIPKHLKPQDWLCDERLTKLLPIAAAAGGKGAQSTLEILATTPARVDVSTLDAIITAPVLRRSIGDTFLPGLPKTQATVAKIALATKHHNQALAELIIHADWTKPELNNHAREIIDYARSQVLGEVEPAPDALLLYAITILNLSFQAPDIAAIPALIARTTGQDKATILEQWNTAVERFQRGTGTFNPEAHSTDDMPEMIHLVGLDNMWRDFKTRWPTQHENCFAMQVSMEDLLQLFDITPGTTMPIHRKTPNTPNMEVAKAALNTLRIQLFSWHPAPAPQEWPVICTLGLYDLEESVITARWFNQTCYHLLNLIDTEPEYGSRCFHNYITALAQAPKPIHLETGITRFTKTAILKACQHLTPENLASLLHISRYLPTELAEWIIEIAGTDRETDTTQTLTEIANQKTADHQIRNFITELLRQNQKEHGTRTFTQILPHQASDHTYAIEPEATRP